MQINVAGIAVGVAVQWPRLPDCEGPRFRHLPMRQRILRGFTEMMPLSITILGMAPRTPEHPANAAAAGRQSSVGDVERSFAVVRHADPMIFSAPTPSQPETAEAWGERANCYAYALNCERPRMTSAVPQACPGAATGRRVLHLGDPAADTEALIEGVIADGQGAIRQVEGSPAHVPAPGPGEYLFALLTGPHGFHFLRRDSATGVWSWKDGNEESVKLKIFYLPSRKFVPITDNLLEPLLVTNKQDFAWRYHGMTFKSFFSVPETAKVDVAA
jgi:hypothetical protein